jgi:hypothetical protein
MLKRMVLPVRRVLEQWYGLLGNNGILLCCLVVESLIVVLPCRQVVTCFTCQNVGAVHGRCLECVASCQLLVRRVLSVLVLSRTRERETDRHSFIFGRVNGVIIFLV